MRQTILLALLIMNSALASGFPLIEKKFSAEHTEIIELIEEEEFLEPDRYSDELKNLYFQEFQKEVKEFKNSGKKNDSLSTLPLILEGLEYKEEAVGLLNREVETHEKLLQDKKWKSFKTLSASYLSFQRDLKLNSITNKQKLVSTSSTACIGGSYGLSNAFWSIELGGCFIVGNTNIKEIKGLPQYNESNIPLIGGKINPRASMIVSSSGTEFGLSLPIFYNQQDVKAPSGYSIKDDKNFMIAPALFSRWALGNLLFETEIGQFIDQSNIYYSIGTAYRF